MRTKIVRMKCVCVEANSKSNIEFVQSIYHLIYVMFDYYIWNSMAARKKCVHEAMRTEKTWREQSETKMFDGTSEKNVHKALSYTFVINVCHSSFIDLSQVCSFNVISLFRSLIIPSSFLHSLVF